MSAGNGLPIVRLDHWKWSSYVSPVLHSRSGLCHEDLVRRRRPIGETSFCSTETFDTSFPLSRADQEDILFMNASERLRFTGSFGTHKFLKTGDWHRSNITRGLMSLIFLFHVFFLLLVKDTIQKTEKTVLHSLLQLHFHPMSFALLEPSSAALKPIICSMTGIWSTSFPPQRISSMTKYTR